MLSGLFGNLMKNLGPVGAIFLWGLLVAIIIHTIYSKVKNTKE
jgi:hypothetical protein